jgi:hypothetical protein
MELLAKKTEIRKSLFYYGFSDIEVFIEFYGNALLNRQTFLLIKKEVQRI